MHISPELATGVTKALQDADDVSPRLGLGLAKRRPHWLRDRALYHRPSNAARGVSFYFSPPSLLSLRVAVDARVLLLGVVVVLVNIDGLPGIADPDVGDRPRREVPTVVEHFGGQRALLCLVLVLFRGELADWTPKPKGILHRKRKGHDGKGK